MREIHADKYGLAVRELLERARTERRPTSLTFGTPAAAARPALEAFGAEPAPSAPACASPGDAACLAAALWLLFDYMPQSHALCQKIATPSGSYWHAILHRREPDARNARYWFSRVGAHSIFPELLADARAIAGEAAPEPLQAWLRADSWDPDLFVGLCTGQPDERARDILLAVQRREWALLFDHNHEMAFGRNA